jgi:hypothetical protein
LLDQENRRKYLISIEISTEEAREHCSQNQSALSGVILISFQRYCGDCSGYIVVYLPFLAFNFYSAYFLFLAYYKWYQSTFLDRNCGLNFFQGRDVFQRL